MDDLQIRSLLEQERKDFIDRFTEVTLSTTMRNIIVNSIPELKGDKDRQLFGSSMFNSKVINTSAKMIQSFFRDQVNLSPEEMDKTNFFASAAAFLKENAIVEADYRFDRTLDKFESGQLDREDQEVGMKIADEFKKLSFTSPGLQERVTESWKILYAREMDDIVSDVKDEVQKEVEDAQDKNKTVQLAVQEIHDAAQEENDENSNTSGSDTNGSGDGGDNDNGGERFPDSGGDDTSDNGGSSSGDGSGGDGGVVDSSSFDGSSDNGGDDSSGSSGSDDGNAGDDTEEVNDENKGEEDQDTSNDNSGSDNSGDSSNNNSGSDDTGNGSDDNPPPMADGSSGDGSDNGSNSNNGSSNDQSGSDDGSGSSSGNNNGSGSSNSNDNKNNKGSGNQSSESASALPKEPKVDVITYKAYGSAEIEKALAKISKETNLKDAVGRAVKLIEKNSLWRAVKDEEDLTAVKKASKALKNAKFLTIKFGGYYALAKVTTMNAYNGLKKKVKKSYPEYLVVPFVKKNENGTKTYKVVKVAKRQGGVDYKSIEASRPMTGNAVIDKFIPASPASISEMKVPYAQEMMESFLGVGIGSTNFEKQINSRLGTLRRAAESDKGYASVLPKLDLIEKRTREALALANHYEHSFDVLGISPHAITRSKDPIAVESAKQIVNRFLTGRGKITVRPQPPKNIMQAVESAFELVQLKQIRESGRFDHISREDIISRESMLFSNIDDFAAGDQAKIHAILDIGGVKMNNVFYPDFITSTGMTIATRDVKDKSEIGKTELVERIIERFKKSFARDPNDHDIEIIESMVDSKTEPYRLANLYEKFLIAGGQTALESSTPLNGDMVEVRARVYTTLVKAVERLKIVKNRKDLESLESYLMDVSF